MATGAMPPAIVVMPMAGRSWYVDDARSNGYGPMARALTTDFIAAIDARFPTVACRAARAIGGLSMGGYGAVLYAFERPDLFAAAFSLSGSLFTEVPPLMLARRRERGERGELFGGVYGEPFDNARFQAWTVFARLDRLVAAAQRPALWLAAGDDDFPSILSGTVRLHQELKRRGIASTLRIDDASHDWTYWRAAADAALSWLSPRLASSCTPAP
jgi:enterochelin esterase family protein